jgi:hypothetical protein
VYGARADAERPAIQAAAISSVVRGWGDAAGAEAADEGAGDVETVCASPGDEEAEGWLEKKEPMLVVPIGEAMAAGSIGRERRAASDAGRWPAVEDPERAALDMTATTTARVAAATRAARAAARVWAEAWDVPSLIPCNTMKLGEPAQP